MEPKEVLSVKTEPGRDGPPILNLPAYLSIQRPQKTVQMSETKTPKMLSRCWFFNIHRRLSQGRVSPLRSISSWLLLLLILLNNWLLELLFSYSLIRTSTLSQFVILVHFKSTLKPTLIQKGKNKHINAPVPYFCEVLPSRTRQTT